MHLGFNLHKSPSAVVRHNESVNNISNFLVWLCLIDPIRRNAQKHKQQTVSLVTHGSQERFYFLMLLLELHPQKIHGGPCPAKCLSLENVSLSEMEKHSIKIKPCDNALCNNTALCNSLTKCNDFSLHYVTTPTPCNNLYLARNSLNAICNYFPLHFVINYYILHWLLQNVGVWVGC